MWLLSLVFLLAVLVLLSLAHTREVIENRRRFAFYLETGSGVRKAQGGDTSILSSRTVQLCVATGAPPTPWIPSREDRQAVTAIERYFARAIPNPTREGRPFVEETLGHGGPQLELYVPIVSSRTPVAVLARNWDPAVKALVSNLLFAGTVEGRLSDIVQKLGFEQTGGRPDGSVTVFRNVRGFVRQRAG
jgi:hypothetical protein